MPPESGEAWLLKQDEATIARVLGPAGRPDPEAARALRSGEVRLGDFVVSERSRAWGVTRRAGTLEQAREVAGNRGFHAEGSAWMPGVPDPRGVPSLARLEMDTRRIVGLVERETGLPSRWKGIVRVETDPDVGWLGMKEPACPIVFHQQVIGDVEMYYVALEESLHSVSVLLPATREEVERLTNVEEAVVGACLELLKPGMRRLFRFDALQKVPLLPDTMREQPYLRQMSALADLRQRTGLEDRPYYFGLLATPLTERMDQVVQWIATHEGRIASQVAQDPDILALVEAAQRK